MNIDNISVKAASELIYLRNDDFGWGEFKTQVSRITNTCEAVFALNYLSPHLIHEESIKYIKTAINGKHENGYENCEHPRDFGWSLLALTDPITESLDDDCGFAVQNIIDWYNNYELDGFGTRNNPSSYSTFFTALTLSGLISFYRAWKVQKFKKLSKLKSSKEELLNIIEDCVDYAIEIATNGGWGATESCEPLPSYTAYMLYAFKLYSNTLKTKKRVINKAIVFLTTNPIDLLSHETDSRPDNRPYRHFTSAWSLLAISGSDSKHFNHYLALELYRNRIESDTERIGWAIYNQENQFAPTTWGTALAARALKEYCINNNCLGTLKFIEDQGYVKFLDSKYHMSDVLPQRKNVFIIHGHDEQALTTLGGIIKDDLGLKPIVLKDGFGEGAPTLIEKFEKHAPTCSYAIALVTPDDKVLNQKEEYDQSRPNVMYELGWFAGRFGRKRIMVIQKKGTEIFSDFGGVAHYTYDKSVKEVYREIHQELKKQEIIRDESKD